MVVGSVAGQAKLITEAVQYYVHTAHNLIANSIDHVPQDALACLPAIRGVHPGIAKGAFILCASPAKWEDIRTK